MRPTELPRGGVEALRDEEVADWLEARPRAALLFWDESDETSRRQRARVEVVAAAVDVSLGALDIRTDALVAQALGVTSVPALVVFRGGEVVERLMGAAPEPVLKDALSGRDL
ncbi:MAG TPA: thioredoxin family protein [Candidatus Thermoplasmatota archaeon]|nr:thioredoxin family protein [Candidatus Thermoplasmatota archaeon]